MGLFRYIGEDERIFVGLKNRNGTTVKAKPNEVFDFVEAPDEPNFIPISQADADTLRAGGEVDVPEAVAPAAPAAPGASSGILEAAEAKAKALFDEATAKAEKILADAKTEAEQLGDDGAEFLASTEIEAEQIIKDAEAEIEKILADAKSGL